MTENLKPIRVTLNTMLESIFYKTNLRRYYVKINRIPSTKLLDENNILEDIIVTDYIDYLSYNQRKYLRGILYGKRI